MDSPNKRILKRLFKSPTALFGMLFIGFVTLVALSATIIAPDNTPDANEQFAVLSELPPGSGFTFMRLKKEAETTENDGSWLTGYNRKYKYVPIEDFSFQQNGKIRVREFKGEGFPAIEYELDSGSFYFQNLKTNFANRCFLLGTDQLGRDIFSRLLLGARVSLLVGIVAVIISTILGILIGSLAGFYRGKVDAFIMWNLSVVWSIPTLLLAMALYISLKDYFQSSFMIIFVAIGLTMWVGMARIVRGQILALREAQFVEAANSLGFSDMRVIMKHILPNVLAPVIVVAAANFANAILIEAGLSFLGLGIQPPTPSWGGMLSEFKDLIGTKLSYMAIFPGLLIMLLVLSFNLVGNGLRDAMDIKN